MAFAWIRKSSEKFKKNLNHKKSGAARRSLRLESLEERCLLAIGVSGAPAPLPAAVIHVANERFVEQLYINLLERNAEPAAISSWSTWLDNAGSRSQLAQSIAGSSEFFSVQVQKLYSRFLYRQPGGSELSNAVNFLSQGGTVDQLKVQVLGSDEYFQFRAGRGVNTLPSALFHDLLLRNIDAASDVAFRAAVHQGVAGTVIAQQVVSSPEYQRLEIQEIYARFLLRDPDSPGFNQSLTALGQGMPPEQLAVAIASSDEAFGIATSQSSPQAADLLLYTRLVSKLCSQVLCRSPEATEVSNWVTRLSTAASMGRSPASVYFELLNSAEALGSIVARWHALYLDDATLLADLKSLAGVIAEAGALKNGADFSNILAQIIGSDGFYSLAGGTDAGCVARVYATVLARAITSQEAADAIIQLGNAPRAAFAQVIISSDEGVRTQVARWYQAFLGRSQSVADLKASAQIGFWVRRIEEYGDLNAVLAEMLSSHEYQGFRSDLFASPQAAWSEAPGPFVQQVTAQRGSKATFHEGRPLVATSYFYWYNAAARADSLRNVGLLNDHPPTQDGFNFLNIDWHKQQFRDMSAAGIDVALPVYWGSPFSDPLTNPDTLKAPNSEFYAFSDPGLRRLVAAREQLVNDGKPAPLLGMFYDTTTLLPSANPKNYSVDLTTPGGKRWFYETIRNFFSHIPASSWATIDGKPMVFLYHPSLARSLDENVFAAVRGM